ncbi:hypothetical protein GCM10009634_65750 [Saccharothrix xinjiangensis]
MRAGWCGAGRDAARAAGRRGALQRAARGEALRCGGARCGAAGRGPAGEALYGARCGAKRAAVRAPPNSGGKREEGRAHGPAPIFPTEVGTPPCRGSYNPDPPRGGRARGTGN